MTRSRMQGGTNHLVSEESKEFEGDRNRPYQLLPHGPIRENDPSQGQRAVDLQLHFRRFLLWQQQQQWLQASILHNGREAYYPSSDTSHNVNVSGYCRSSAPPCLLYNDPSHTNFYNGNTDLAQFTFSRASYASASPLDDCATTLPRDRKQARRVSYSFSHVPAFHTEDATCLLRALFEPGITGTEATRGECDMEEGKLESNDSKGEADGHGPLVFDHSIGFGSDDKVMGGSSP